MKMLVALFFIFASPLALADNRESGGGARTLFCHDQFTAQESTTFVTAEIVSATKFGKLTVTAASLHGVTLTFQGLELKPTVQTGVKVLTGEVHATRETATLPPGVAFEPNFSVILTLGTEWLSSRSYTVGQLQFYCDGCGGGIPTFQPNLYCESQH